jgi:hypothetical protein
MYSYPKQIKMTVFQKWRTGRQIRFSLGLVPVGGGGYKEKVKEDECGGNLIYSCMNMEK